MQTITTHRRAGKSLIEMAVVIAMMGMLLPVIASILYVVFQANDAGRAEMATTLSLSRLGPQFRNDLHDATTVELQGAEPVEQELTLQQADDRQIIYQATEQRLTRSVHKAGKQVAQEQYRLPDRTVAMQLSADSRWATLQVGPRLPANTPPTVHIDASRIWKVTSQVGRADISEVTQ